MLSRSSRRSSDDYASSKKRTSSRRKDSESPRRGSTEKCKQLIGSDSFIASRKREDKRDEKRETRCQKSVEKTKEVNESHMLTDIAKTAGDYSKFPQITPKTIEVLKKRGISHLFPV